jgi:putative SOS response-associated peptidase YedK
MPVMIAPGHFKLWLNDDDPGSEFHKMAVDFPLDEPMKICPVSNLVNGPKVDDPRCIEPLRIDRDLFEKPWWVD